MKIISKIVNVKKAMAVPVSEQRAQKMREKGIYVLQDMISRMPNSTQADTMQALQDIRSSGASEFFNAVTLRTVVSLPQIYILKPEDVFEFEGKRYVALDVEDGSDWKTPGVVGKAYTSPSGVQYAKGQRVPGEVVALNVDNGNLEVLPLPQIRDQIIAPTEDIDRVLRDANEEISKYNSRIRSITNALGASKIVLQIARAKEQIQTRLDELSGIIRGNQRKLEQVSTLTETQEGWDTDLMNDVRSGRMSLKDAYDSILYQYQSRPENLISDIEQNVITVPPELRDGLLAISHKEIEKKREVEEKERQKDLQTQQRIREEGIPEIHETELEPFVRGDIPSAKQRYKKVDKARSIHHEIARLNNAIEGSQKDVVRLTDIKQSMENMEKYMGDLEKGQRSKNFLNTPEGQPVLDAMNDFLKKAMLFIETYDVNTKIVQDNKINPKLFGPKGTKGNALLAAAMTRMYNVVKETINMYGGGGTPPSGVAVVPQEREVPEAVPERLPIANAQDQIKRMSELLWKPFEDRMRLK